jgi:hypothetical protein
MAHVNILRNFVIIFFSVSDCKYVKYPILNSRMNYLIVLLIWSTKISSSYQFTISSTLMYSLLRLLALKRSAHFFKIKLNIYLNTMAIRKVNAVYIKQLMQERGRARACEVASHGSLPCKPSHN